MIKTITKEENLFVKKEKRISKNIERYIDIIHKTKDLSKEIELEYIKKARKDKHYKELLFNAHLKLVIDIARSYSDHKETLEDLIQEGIQGMERALVLYDPKFKVRFNTYARRWIRAFILKSFSDNVRSFRVPNDIATKLGQINKVIEKLSKKSEHDPSDRQIAKELGYETGYITFLRKHLLPHFTMDFEIKNKGGHNDNASESTFGDLMPDNSRDDASEFLIRSDNIKKIREAIKKLPKRERFVIENRYGLTMKTDGEGRTLAEVGEEMDLTAERVRQIQRDAEKRLKKAINR